MEPKKTPSRTNRILRYPLRIARQVYNLPRFTSNLHQETQNLHQTLDWTAKTVETLKAEVNYLRQENSAEELAHRLNRLDERLNDVVHQLAIMNEQHADKNTSSKEKHTSSPSSDKELLADEHLLDNFYVEFERWFRGTPAEIKKRQEVYVPYFTKSKVDSQKHPVVDIGCGRGEFVQSLADKNIRAIGLDLNKAMVDHVKALKLEAVQDDALSYLRKQKSGSLMAVTGFHIVEHIPFIDLVHIFDECYRTLVPGGFIIFETPNPENLIVGACNFYADPSHLHPLPPAMLEFTLKTRGFNKTEIKRLHPIKADIKSDDPMVQELAERVFGPQDYAVIAYK